MTCKYELDELYVAMYQKMSGCRYASSKDGWSEEQKRSEMQAPEARYLIARSADNPNDRKGFLLFQMVHEETMDDDIMAQVAYW